jgi:hypothetical protein
MHCKPRLILTTPDADLTDWGQLWCVVRDATKASLLTMTKGDRLHKT